MKFTYPYILQNLNMMLSPNQKTMLTEVVEEYLSYNISKFGRKMTNIYEVMIKFPKILRRYFGKIEILTLGAILMTS